MGAINLRNTSFCGSRRQVCLAILEDRNFIPIFSNEIEKQHFLSQLSHMRGEELPEIYAFCILDRKAVLLLKEPEEGNTVLGRIADFFQTHYRRNYPERNVELHCAKQEHFEMSEAELAQACVGIHMIPVRQNRADKASHYWWSSFRDYCLPRKTGVTEVGWLLKGEEEEKYIVRKFAALHNNKTFQNEICDQNDKNTKIDLKK